MATKQRVHMSSQFPKNKVIYSHSKNQRVVFSRQVPAPFTLSSEINRRSALSTISGFGKNRPVKKGKNSMQGFSNIIANFGSQSKGNFVQSYGSQRPTTKNKPSTTKSSVALVPPLRRFMTAVSSAHSTKTTKSAIKSGHASSKSNASRQDRYSTGKDSNRNTTAVSRGTDGMKSNQSSRYSQVRPSKKSNDATGIPMYSKLQSRVHDSRRPRLQPIAETIKQKPHSRRTTSEITRVYSLSTPFNGPTAMKSNNGHLSERHSRPDNDRYDANKSVKKEDKPKQPIPTLKSRLPKSVFSSMVVGSNKFGQSNPDDNDANKLESQPKKDNKFSQNAKKSSKPLPSFAKNRRACGAASDSDLSKTNKKPTKPSKPKYKSDLHLNFLPINLSYYKDYGVTEPKSLGMKKWASDEKIRKSPYKLNLKVNPESTSNGGKIPSPRDERRKLSSENQNLAISPANQELIKGLNRIYGKSVKQNLLRGKIAEKVRHAQEEQKLREKIQSKNERRLSNIKKKEREEDIRNIKEKHNKDLQKRYANTHMSMKALSIAVIAGMKLKQGWMPRVDDSKKSQPLYTTTSIKKPKSDQDKASSVASSRNSIALPAEEGHKFLPALDVKHETQQPLSYNLSNRNSPKSMFNLRAEDDESILPRLKTPPDFSKSLDTLQREIELPKTPDFLDRQTLHLDDDDDDQIAKSDNDKHVKFSDMDDNPVVGTTAGYSNPQSPILSGSSRGNSPIPNNSVVLPKISSRDNSPHGPRSSAPSDEGRKLSSNGDDAIAKRLAALRKGSKIGSGESSHDLLSSQNGLEQRLKDNKLIDDDADADSSKGSLTEVPDIIQQKLKELKLKNRLDNPGDNSSDIDQGDSRRNSSVYSLGSLRTNQRPGALGSASSGYASEGISHLPSTATDPIRVLPTLGNDSDKINNVSGAVKSSLQSRLARLRSNLDKNRAGRPYKPLSRNSSLKQLALANSSAQQDSTATPTSFRAESQVDQVQSGIANSNNNDDDHGDTSNSPISSFDLLQKLKSNADNHSAGSRRSSLFDTDGGVQKKLEILKNNLNDTPGYNNYKPSSGSRIGSRRTSLFDEEEDVAKRLNDLRSSLNDDKGLFQSSSRPYTGSNIGSRRASLFDNGGDIQNQLDSLRDNASSNQGLYNSQSQDLLQQKLAELRSTAAVEG
ncbi:uncharacterized protein TRIADDRAFT_61428 [Trichoplax adhaerens]|uniref:Uncharacterized protein n=1 Tax=Trichoplax adhaerens TaxID=10228 RepID=B3SAY7_TRIAD|nr:hypothetical protein TRIADDRAFT_61428 [Trichoplax adhaerens]EDV20014.1 hypothetical protein TRIADDRAFT_61428 [Trichoplax adhaerens]|eukprot:XP_002117398.1 hypothetical protein TRIADDRAFT_61428 [Trichoplax adhaerens]